MSGVVEAMIEAIESCPMAFLEFFVIGPVIACVAWAVVEALGNA